MAHNCFNKPGLARAYAKVRPSPPPDLIRSIIDYLRVKVPSPLKHAVDVACGTGQSTTVLSPYFETVTGLDLSAAQIAEAQKSPNKPPNVSFGVSPAETLPFEDGTVTLVTASQCFHWLDEAAFIEEARRILAPNGALAIYSYQVPTPIYQDISHELHELNEKLYEDLRPYCPVDRSGLATGYVDYKLPLADFERKTFVRDLSWTAQDCFVYVESLSFYQNMRAADPDKARQLLRHYKDSFLSRIQRREDDPSHIPVGMRFHYTLLLGRRK